MHPFAISRADDLAKAIAAHAKDGQVAFIAGGTDLLGLMKDRAALPERLLDINGLPDMARIEALSDGGLRIGALARMSDVAADMDVRRRFPVIAEACCSPHPANCATWRRSAATSCSAPVAPISAMTMISRATSGARARAARRYMVSIAITRSSVGPNACVATNPSDLAVAFAALDAKVRARRRGRTIDPVYRIPSLARQHAGA